MSSYKLRDKKSIWHPYTQMLNAAEHIPIVRAAGSKLYDENGNSFIDAISSWWTNLHGHAHPYIAKAISEQVAELDHVLFAGFTHPGAIELAERILKLLPENQTKAFYSDNGSTAVEVALKMSIQFWRNKGLRKNRILAFENAYHGDTFGSMSVSGRGAFNRPFNDQLFEVDYIPIPREDREHISLLAMQDLLTKRKEEYACFIFEPLVQGAAGMNMYQGEPLSQLISVCRINNVLTIADEVMTGFGRTGDLFAVDSLSQKPDMICLSKGITGGIMPLGLTTCSENIYEAFLSQDLSKTFFHGHSYTANPIACRAALASLDLLLDPVCTQNRNFINQKHLAFKQTLQDNGTIENVRVTGTILAFELSGEEATGYFNSRRNYIYEYFLDKGILLRPLGNVVYIMPPYSITGPELDEIYSAILKLASSPIAKSNIYS